MTTTYYVGGLLEKVNLPSGVIEWRHKVPAGSSVALVTRRSNSTNDTYYLTSDHLGSTDLVVNSGGAVQVTESFGAFGERRGQNWQGQPSAADKSKFASTTRGGFTGHEMLDAVNLIHMNGRVYDQLNGRFLSADPLVADPGQSQNHNRYSYVMNNPLARIDPSGYACVLISTGYWQCDGQTGGDGTDGFTTIEEVVSTSNNSSDYVLTSLPMQSSPVVETVLGGLSLKKETKCVGTKFADFFRENYIPASFVATQYNVDPALLLGLAAAESGHGGSPQATSQNNPFGATPGGDKNSGISYSSSVSAWWNWGQQWGPRVYNVGGDIHKFMNNLLLDNQGSTPGIPYPSDARGPYNTLKPPGGNPNWRTLVYETTVGKQGASPDLNVRARLNNWLKSGC